MVKLHNKICLKLITVFLITCIALGVGEAVFAEELSLEAKQFNEKYIEWLELPEEERENSITPPIYVKNAQADVKTIGSSFKQRSFGASSRYNLRDSIFLKVKDQGQTEQCWAFATTTQLESYMAKLKNKTVEYSPRHIEYSTISSFSDEKNPYGFNRILNSGGNTYVSYAYMTSGQGPVLEEDMPFVNTYGTLKASEVKNKKVQAQLEEFIVFPSIYKEKNGNTITYSNGQTGSYRVEYTSTQVRSVRNEIKEHIMKYGGVVASTATKNIEFFSNPEQVYKSKSYYCDDESVQADHAITIIGWDDNYAVSNFNPDHRPSSPGAWLIQNSYGSEIADGYGNKFEMFDGGLLYISYEDFLIEQILSGIIKLDDIDYDKIYQYDPLGMRTSLSMAGLNEMYAANVFKKSSEVEYLTEVGLYTSGTGNETFEIYVNSVDGNLKNITKVKSVGKTNSDYITVKLDKPIALTGTSFAVAVKYISSSGNVEVPVEARITFDFGDIWATATSNSGESFWTLDSRLWHDLKDEYVSGISNMNACIKAFTKKTQDNKPNITLSSNAYTIDSSSNLIRKVSPNTSLTKFKNNLKTNGTVKIYNTKGTEVSKTSTISTGMKLKLTETGDSYTIVVTGDVNGDGKVTVTDLIMIKKDLVGIEKLKGIYKTAGDINGKDGITVADMTKIKQAICELIQL